ncbi:MAG TPA: methionyl-tRNA formyltransferase, partial [Burkholderiales bacterium]|nr:methionyl-tRNA formyltransferase [Burkholderiales bacterium]
MRIVFAGSPEFAAVSLQALVGAGHEIPLVLTQPDRPAGRGRKLRSPAVKQLAQQLALPVLQPVALEDRAVQEAVAAARPEALVVVAYGLIVPPALLALAPRGALNVHASLLPRWRGAAPIQRALLAGDAETGVTIMRMDEGLDTGPILLQEAIPIAPEDTAGTLHDKLAALGARLLLAALAQAPTPRPQDERFACYAPRIGKGESEIDWRRPAVEIERMVRAFDPTPGARTRLGAEALKIWRARVEHGAHGAAPGTVRAASNDGIVVACGAQALRVLELQRAGGRRMCARAFLAGAPLAPG